MALNFTGFHTWCLSPSVPVTRAIPGDLGRERKGTFMPPSKEVCVGTAAGWCVGAGRAQRSVTQISVSELLGRAC